MRTINGSNVLVTGGAGFIGSHLVDRLVESTPKKLVVVDNLFLGKEENLRDAYSAFPNLRFVVQDASDIRTMEELIISESIDFVFDLAVIPLPASLERPQWTIDVNVGIVSVLCELLRRERFSSLLHFSTSEVYGSAQCVPMDEQHPLAPTTPYAASKAAGDHIVNSYGQTFGVDATTIRPFNNFGPRQNDRSYAGIIPIAIRRALEGETIEIHGDGMQTRDFIFVKDVAEAVVCSFEAEETSGETINVASGREVTIKELVETITELTDSDSRIVHAEARPADVRRHCGGIEKAHRLFGFAPQVDLRAGLVQTIDWYRAHG